jgi:hypothetical protein
VHSALLTYTWLELKGFANAFLGELLLFSQKKKKKYKKPKIKNKNKSIKK